MPRSAATSVEPREALDVTMRFGVVRFDGVAVPGSGLVGPVGGAAGDVEWELELAAQSGGGGVGGGDGWAV